MGENNPVLIIGPSLQKHGIGGVTIHVQRLLDYMAKIEFPFTFLDYKKTGLPQLIKAIRSIDVVHLHPLDQFLLVFICNLYERKCIVTVHGNYGRFGWFKNLLVKESIKNASVPIVVNEKSFDICKHFNKNTEYISAFIPPQKDEFLQEEIVNRVNELNAHGRSIVSTNAYNVAFDKRGNDIYGIDFLVQFFRSSANMSLVVSDPSGNYKKRYQDYQSESIVFIDYPHPYFELLKRVDFFVRNTSTDGDALSVREALYLGVPSLCSDIVDRPKGVRLFKYNDKESFLYALTTPTEGCIMIENSAERIIEIYKRLL